MSVMIADDEKEFSNRVSSEKDWRNIVQMVSDLPPLPHIAMHAMKLMENPDISTLQITSVVSKDAALVARLLKISNSAMFARRAKVSTLNQAILMVGFKTLKGIVLAATLQGMSRHQSPLENHIWKNSVCVAICASHIAKILKHRFVEDMFTLGLLHDLGKMVMVSHISKQYAKIAKMTSNGRSFTDVEQDVLGYTHALLGALVSKKWNFPEEISRVILHHHDPVDLPLSDDIATKTAIIQASDLLAHSFGVGHERGYPDTTQEAIDALYKIGISTESVESVIDECRLAYENNGDSLNSAVSTGMGYR